MPKEIITECKTEVQLSHLSVQWGRDDAVTIDSWHSNRQGVDATGSPNELRFPDGEPIFGEWEPDVIWHLRRDDLNKLIRVLRRARDQAYGRDE